MKDYNIVEFELNEKSKQYIYDLANQLVAKYGNVNNEQFLNISRFFAYKLPEELILKILDFYRNETGDGYLIIRKFITINDNSIGNTPENWQPTNINPNSNYLDFLCILIIALISEPISYIEQRPNGGGMVHDVMPIKGVETIQIGTGSKDELLLHTEDITLNNSCDFLVLLCIRNKEFALNSLSILNRFSLSDELKEILFSDIFIFPPDPNYERIHQNKYYNKTKRSILFGNKLFPYIRVAPYDMIGKTEISNVAKKALISLNKEIEANKIFIQLNPGDLILLNNKRVLHGRSSFVTNFGKDKRWMKRALGLSDLMKASNYRNFRNPYLIEEVSFNKEEI